MAGDRDDPRGEDGVGGDGEERGPAVLDQGLDEFEQVRPQERLAAGKGELDERRQTRSELGGFRGSKFGPGPDCVGLAPVKAGLAAGIASGGHEINEI